ncbi:MAG TPA: acyl-CoA carboxylase subunit beta, partial [Candidatus Limnocylindrales bacterium]|nr:acyl-CoA carboxylase subunit beta [Candidatus Limnocylindrales bacterium]
MNDQLEVLRAMRARALEGGGPERIAQQHARGKLTARERLALLLDDGSFQEMGALATHEETDFGLADQRFPGDGVVAGFGKINGRRVAVFAQDFTVLGGSFSRVQSNKISRIQDLALESGVPLVGLNDSGGARIQEGVASLAAYGEVFVRNVLSSGVIPQISLILGPCAGGAVYSPALTDFVIMTRGTSTMFVTGPDVVEAVTGEQVSIEELGGPDVHEAVSGVAHLVADDEHQALELCKRLLGYLPQNNNEDPPQVVPYDPADRMDDALNTIIPADEADTYDVRSIIGRVFDRDSFLEIHPAYAPNAVVGFARLDGFSVGIVASQPDVMAGVLDINASDKIARFIRICDVYNIPIVTFVDCPGFLPGVDQEARGIIRHGAKIIYAYSEATVPKISIVTRRAMGGAYVAMSSRQMRTDVAFAWPGAQIAVMGAEGAVRILYSRQLRAAADPDAARAEFVQHYRDAF